MCSYRFSYHYCANNTQLILSFPPSDTTISAQISACLADISSCMAVHQLKINPSRMELLFITGGSSPCQDLAIFMENLSISPLVTAHIFDVTIDNHLFFSSHIASVDLSLTLSEGFICLSKHATLVLLQSLFVCVSCCITSQQRVRLIVFLFCDLENQN